jgi:hypothetical protein
LLSPTRKSNEGSLHSTAIRLAGVTEQFRNLLQNRIDAGTRNVKGYIVRNLLSPQFAAQAMTDCADAAIGAMQRSR